MSFTIKDESGLTFELDKNNFTAKVVESNVQGKVFIPRSINHQNQEYIITKIAENSFKQNQNIESIDFPEDSQLDSIGEYAFSFSNIESITLPPSIKELKYGWCSHTWNLVNISISPENDNFSYLDEDHQIIVGKSRSIIDHYDIIIFGCRNIEKIEIPSFIRIICPFAFSGCEVLRKVTFSIDSELEIIGDFAFSFTKVKKVRIPSQVKHIGCGSFSECHYITSFDFSEDSQLQTIGKEAFSASSLDYISIPSRVREIAECAFAECDKLSCVDFSAESDLCVISKNAFSHSNIESILIPSNVTKISEGTFSECYNLKEIEFSQKSKLKIIEKDAFSNSLLESILIPASVESIVGGWCSYTMNLNKLKISPGNRNFLYIDNKLLVGKSRPDNDYYDVLLFARRDINKTVIPSFIKTIGPFTFSDCKKLKKIQFTEDSQLSIIGKHSFNDSSIKKATIPANVTVIDEYAFSSCKNLKTVSFQKGSQLKTICKYAFSSSSIESLFFPENLEELKSGWCCYTCNLTDIEISPLNCHFSYVNDDHNLIVEKSDKNIDCFDVIVFACRNIEYAFIPSNIKCISSFAFFGCCNLKTIIFDEDSQLQSINKYAFADSSIENIKFPKQVENIGIASFTRCNNIKSIQFPLESQEISIAKNAFAQSSIKNLLIPSKNCSLKQNSFSYCMNLSSAEFLSEFVVIDIFCFYHSENFVLISFPNAKKVTVDQSSFLEVSDEFSLFSLAEVEILKYDFFDLDEENMNDKDKNDL